MPIFITKPLQKLQIYLYTKNEKMSGNTAVPNNYCAFVFGLQGYFCPLYMGTSTVH